MKKIIFVVVILSTLCVAYRWIDGTIFVNFSALLQAAISLLVFSIIFFNKKLIYLFKQTNKDYAQCLVVVKGMQQLVVYLSVIYWCIYTIEPLMNWFFCLPALNVFGIAFRIPLYLCLFNFLILLPLEAKLKIKLASEE